MSPEQFVHQLMCEVGPALDVQQVTASPDLYLWQVVFDAETVFDIEYDPAFERVVFSSRVARLQPVGRLRVCELLLNVNFPWRETGGVRMALDSRTEDVVLMFEMPVASLRLAQLTTVLGTLARRHRVWRQLLLDPADARDIDAVPDHPPMGVGLA